MRYRIKLSHNINRELQRATRAMIEEAALSLLLAVRERVHGIHDTRKCFKEIRAILRLLKPILDNQWLRQELEFYKQAGRQLSCSRDAQVMKQTWNRLCQRHPTLNADLVRELDLSLELRERQALRRDASRKQLLEMALELEAKRDSYAQWPIAEASPADVLKGLQQLYRKSHKAWMDARQQPENQRFHESRKRFKDLYYALRLLKPLWNKPLRKQVDLLAELTEVLGLANDLAVLEQYLKCQFDSVSQDDLQDVDDTAIKAPISERAAAATQDQEQFEAAEQEKYRQLFDIIEDEHARLCMESHRLASQALKQDDDAFIAQLEQCWRKQLKTKQ